MGNCIKACNDEFLYNSLNQLISQSKAEFFYDQHGNLLRKILDGEETRFESDLLSQLVTVKQLGQPTLTFTYDPLGRLLVEKHLQINGKIKNTLCTSRYMYVGYQEIGSLDEKGNIESLKVPGLAGDELSLKSVALELQGEKYLPIHDQAGNIVALANSNDCKLKEQYQYTAFGEETIYDANGEVQAVSLLANPWRFAGKRVNQRTGLIHFGLRFYDPQSTRWISQDPAGFLDGPNLYIYLHNNPLNYLDRFGLATESNSQEKFEDYFYGEVETHCYCEKHRTCKRGGDIGKTVSSSQPKITYYNFEKMFPTYEPSTTFDLSYIELPNLPGGLGIGFINGVWNTLDMAKVNAQHISRLAGGYNIHATYNATHGTSIDLAECYDGLNYVATEPVHQLHAMWNSFFEKSPPEIYFLMVCHSQGAIHVRNALLDYPPELRKRILVVAIAPAAYIYLETCAHVYHYRAKAWRDFVPRIDTSGAKRAKGTIIDLDSHKRASIFDHEFTSLTYQEILQRHLDSYIQSQGKFL